jgi:glucan-binding YG repeat protein
MIQKQAFYMHPESGDVQAGEEWIAESSDWYYLLSHG